MEKIVKVIKGIEKCIAIPGMCRGCPYERCDEAGRQFHDCSTDVLRDALELLKEYKEHEELLTKVGYYWMRSGETLALCKKSKAGHVMKG